MIGEIQERRPRAAFLAHENQRDVRRQQLQGDGGPQGWLAPADERQQAFAEGAVAGLVMILQEQHERRGRQVGAGLAAMPRRIAQRGLTLVGIAFGQAARQHGGRLRGVVCVVAVSLARKQMVQHVMRVVVPLGIVALP